MMLTEMTAVPQAALPVQGLKDHLRLGTGFADDGMQDGLIEAYLRAALAVIEGRIGKALIARRYRLDLATWRSLDEQALPIAPVSAILSLTVTDAAGGSVVMPASRYKLVQDTHRPKLTAVGFLLPQIPEDGQAEILFDAGFGATWSQVPADLAQAVLLLAADFHEHRHDAGDRPAGLPVTVQALIERWRTVRVLGGGAA